MELQVSLQAVQFGLAALLGVCLGLIYDFLRCFRKKIGLTLLTDVLFSLLVLVSLLLFALYVGRGQLRLFMLPGIALGSTLYFLTLSRLVLKLLDGICRLLSFPVSLIGKAIRWLKKIFKKICKKIVAFVKKKGIISNSGNVGRARRSRRKKERLPGEA